jgi:hypothetical protein
MCDSMCLQHAISQLIQLVEKECRVFKNIIIGMWDQSAPYQCSDGNEAHSTVTLMVCGNEALYTSIWLWEHGTGYRNTILRLGKGAQDLQGTWELNTKY